MDLIVKALHREDTAHLVAEGRNFQLVEDDLRHIRSSAPIRNRALTTQFIDDMVFWNLGQSRATGASSRESDVMSLVEYEQSAVLGRLILNRPQAGHAVTHELLADLGERKRTRQ